MELLNEIETGRAVAALEGVSEWIRSIPTEEQAKKYRKALESLYSAVGKTRKYQRHLQTGQQRETATEDDLSDAWFRVAAEIRPYDPDLASRCEVKGYGWADQRVWNDPRFRDQPIGLEAMLSNYFGAVDRLGKHEDALEKLKGAMSRTKFPEQKETLYDTIVRMLKNNKVVVGILLLVVVLGGAAKIASEISSLRDFFFPRKTILQVSASIERYDFMAGRIEPVKSLAPITRDIAQVKDAANDVVKEIVAAIGPIQGAFDVTLQIENHVLRASRSVRAAVIIVTSPTEQMGRITHDVGETANFDLAALSVDRQFLDPQGNVIKIELTAPTPGLDRVSLPIFKRGDYFSFSSDHADQQKTIQFTSHKIRLIVQKFEVRSDRVQNAGGLFDSAIKQALAVYSFFEIRDETVESLEQKRAALEQHMTPGMAKSALASEHSVDYVIAGNLASQ